MNLGKLIQAINGLSTQGREIIRLLKQIENRLAEVEGNTASAENRLAEIDGRLVSFGDRLQQSTVDMGFRGQQAIRTYEQGNF